MNTYPTVRGFTAIGTGGDDFVQAMVVAVESVIQQPIPQVCFIYQHFFCLSISILFRKFGHWHVAPIYLGMGLLIYVVIVFSATTVFF